MMDDSNAKLIMQLGADAADPDALARGFAALRGHAVDDAARLRLAEEGAIAVVLGGIERHLDNAMVCEKGCCALRGLMMVSANQLAISTEGCGLVLSVLRGHAGRREVVQQACACLGKLAQSSALQWPIEQKEDAIHAVLLVMQQHACPATHEQGCVLLGLLTVDQPARSTIVSAGGVHAVMASLRTHAHVDYVVEQALTAIAGLSVDAFALDQIISGGGVDLVIDSIRRHGDDVQREGVIALSNLAAAEVVQRVLLERDALELVFDVMDKQPDDHVLQERGCKAVKVLALQMHDKVTVAVGGLKTMTNVLSRHKDNPKIAIRALGAVRVMLANPDNANAADISTILQLVPTCMHRMQEDPVLAKQGCSFMRTVAKYEKFQESINVAGGVEATICVLKNHRLNISVQKEGWNALVSLFVLPGNISNAHRSGVVWVLVSTILEHMGNDKLQELLCLVMRILSVHASLLSEIHHSGGLEAVLQVASEHIDWGQVTQHVLATLVNLVSGEGCSQFFEQHTYSRAISFTSLALKHYHRSDQLAHQLKASTLARLLSAFPSHFKLLARESRHLFISTVLRRMHESGDAILQEEYCSILRLLALNMDNQQTLFEAGAISAVLQAMRAHIDKESVLVGSLQALRNLAVSEYTKPAMMQASVLPLLEQAMSRFPSSSRVQEQGLSVLRNLTTDERIRDAIVTQNVLDSVLNALTTHAQDAVLQARGCATLRNLFLHAAIRSLKGGQSLPLILKALDAHHDVVGVQIEGLGALWNLSIDSAYQLQLGQQRGIRKAFGGMKRHATEASVQEQACGMLSNLALSETNHSEIMASCAHIVSVMERYIVNTGVQTQCCAIMRNLSGARSNQDVIISSGGATALLNAMSTHYRSAGVQEYGSGCLMNLAAIPESRVAIMFVFNSSDLIGRQNGCEILLKCLNAARLNAELPKVLERGFGAIRNLAQNKDMQMRLGLSAIVLIIECLQDSTNQALADVCVEGISALRSLGVSNDGNKEAMYRAGAIELVVMLMQSHAKHEVFHEQACLALATIISTRDRVGSAKLAGVDEQLHQSMEIFATNSIIQQRGQQMRKKLGNVLILPSLQEADTIRTDMRRPNVVYFSSPCTLLRYNEDDDEGRQRYIGQLQDGKRHGLGVLEWSDGCKYSGDWRDDRSCGHGVEQYSGHSCYAGEFFEDLRHGYGQFDIAPGLSYCGQFEDGELHGMLYILETDAGNTGVAHITPARAEHGQIYREMDHKIYADEDPRKAIAVKIDQVVAALKARVLTAVSTARAASQEAHDLVLDVSSGAKAGAED